jgi:hypothetical protein
MRAKAVPVGALDGVDKSFQALARRRVEMQSYADIGHIPVRDFGLSA